MEGFLSLPVVLGQVFRNLLLGAAAAGQLVHLVLYLVEALGHAVGGEPSLWVVVPALVDRAAHYRHALTRQSRESQILLLQASGLVSCKQVWTEQTEHAFLTHSFFFLSHSVSWLQSVCSNVELNPNTLTVTVS